MRTLGVYDNFTVAGGIPKEARSVRGRQQIARGSDDAPRHRSARRSTEYDYSYSFSAGRRPGALAAGATFGGTDPAYDRDVGFFDFFRSDWISNGVPIGAIPLYNGMVTEFAFSFAFSLGF